MSFLRSPFAALGLTLLSAPAAAQAPAPAPIKVGLIGLDTSHVTAFTAALNDPALPGHVPGARVVAGFRGGSPDVENSAKRIDGFTNELRDKWKIEIVASIEELLGKVDAVMITSVDGRTHLRQARPVLAARKRVFIDKPFAASVKDAREIVRLARQTGTPIFSSSSLRFAPEFQAARTDPNLGDVVGAMTWGPAPTEPHHPDLFWYGIHAVEALFTIMGPGCVSVSRMRTDGADVVIGRWRDGRLGTMRGIRDGAKAYGAVVYGQKNVVTIDPKKTGYQGLLIEVVKFFQTGQSPVPPEETLEIMGFMAAADTSKTRRGAEVALATPNKS